MNLSKGYYFGEADYGFLVRQGEENRYDSIDSLKDAVVVTQSGSVQEALYREQVGSCREEAQGGVKGQSLPVFRMRVHVSTVCAAYMEGSI